MICNVRMQANGILGGVFAFFFVFLEFVLKLLVRVNHLAQSKHK